MTNKQIIINSVNVARCNFFYVSTGGFNICGCRAGGGLGFTPKEKMGSECKDNPNCHYKQIQRKEQELKISQHYNSELSKYILRIGELFKITQIPTTTGKNSIEYYAILSSAIKNRIEYLQIENEKFKNFVKHQMCYVDCENWFERFEYTFEEWKKDLIKHSDRYKQALEELNEIAKYAQSLPCMKESANCEKCSDEITNNGQFCMQKRIDEIKTIINEVLKDER